LWIYGSFTYCIGIICNYNVHPLQFVKWLTETTFLNVNISFLNTLSWTNFLSTLF
jgi:hypothetical protein